MNVFTLKEVFVWVGFCEYNSVQKINGGEAFAGFSEFLILAIGMHYTVLESKVYQLGSLEIILNVVKLILWDRGLAAWYRAIQKSPYSLYAIYFQEVLKESTRNA